MSFRNYYDTSYGRTRGDSRSTSADRPASVTAKYINTTPTYKTSSIPIRRERSATREQNESPITAIANKYASYKLGKDDKPTSKYIDKNDSYNKLTVPTLTSNKSRDVSPVSTSSKYSLSRSSRHLSPDRRSITTSSLTKGRSRDPSPTDRDKDIPNKADKSTGYNSLSSYKLYPRTSTYTRPVSRTENKPEITVNRYAIANRIATNYLRSPSIDKSSRTSVSPTNNIDIPKIENDRLVNNKTNSDLKETPDSKRNGIKESNQETNDTKPIENGKPELPDDVPETITVITRHTSPTPPGNSAYIRSRRADMAKTIEKTITRSKIKREMVDKEIQSDRLDDTSRTSRFAGASRASVSNWSSYSPNLSHYTGYAGRYSTHYGNSRECSTNTCNNEKSHSSYMENNTDTCNKNNDVSESEKEQKEVSENSVNVIENNTEINLNKPTVIKDDEDTSEIIINVNLKLKKAKTKELVSPEVTITNSQLPPQAPKTEGITAKVKKIKVRKSSTDSSSDSSTKKKVIKKRSKSVSSTDSDQSSETKSKTSPEAHCPSPLKSLSRNSSSNNLKGKSSRESNSPESSATLSTQSSISEDEILSKSKTGDLSRTSADEASISLDKSNKQQSAGSTRNEGAEEAKSFLIRALAPVTSLFKTRTESSDNTHWLDSSTSESTGKDASNLITESDPTTKSKTGDIIATNGDNVVKLKSIKQIDSEENHNWAENDLSSNSNKQRSSSEKSINKKIRHIESGERAWWLESNSDSKNDNQEVSTDISEPKKSSKNYKYDTDEKPWWLDSCANIPEGIQRLTPPRKVSSDSEKSEKYDFYKERHNDSGEKEWWLTGNENSSNKESQTCEISMSSSDHRSFPLRRIRHVESGERPWWLSSSKNIPEGVEKLPTPPPRDGDSSDSEEVEAYGRSKPSIPPFPLNLPDDEPLGDRKSPEGLETPRPTETAGRRSPYENSVYRIKGYKGEKYLARYTDIENILANSGQKYSPYDLILVRRTEQKYDGDSSECEEIDPTQVRIHDSTPQRPVIKKIRCRSEIVDYHEDNSMEDETSLPHVHDQSEEMCEKVDNAMDTLNPRKMCSPRRKLLQQQLDLVNNQYTNGFKRVSNGSPLKEEMVVGIVLKAKEELAKSQSREIIKSPTKINKEKLENELRWEGLEKDRFKRKFTLCDLDFSDLQEDSEEEMQENPGTTFGIPPPPPKFMMGPPPPPPPSSFNIPPPPQIKKNKKTVKLFWREILDIPVKKDTCIWDDLPTVILDTQTLEYMFETRSNDVVKDKLCEPKRNVMMILDAKRSNAINIAIKKLPPVETIKTAILKMDATLIGREGIEKLITMLPTEEELSKIQEAQSANTDLPLGSAEQFLMALASISELSSRLKLWIFKLDFDNLENEIAEPMMDLKLSTEVLKTNKTFKCILSVLRSVGSFLNGNQVKGFRLEYLSKVIEVKDTVYKHPLLYHICEMVNQSFPESTDFYSEVGPVLRASKVDFDILSLNLLKLEADCKASFDHLKQIPNDETAQAFKTKINEFLNDAAIRIISLKYIKTKIMRRYDKFLLYLGVPPSDVANTPPTPFLKTISEFSLEYRTTRERILLKNAQKERIKIREKMKTPSTPVQKSHDDKDECPLTKILESDNSYFTFKKMKKVQAINSGSNSKAEEEMMDLLMKSPLNKKKPAARKRARLAEQSKWTSMFDRRERE